ncbi:MotA/TolQ/ExbB proton channel family protein [Halobacteriovorax sp. GB3]|uniref:motility protein A n=1 Tax=Halobacteriovorax sp. GB3 TaxID=2719615 RepID=UPI0023620E8A|nr:MotA/TolQ/ExbB proton channel family protein [Halobacteriovorax sp. GB3]MDD0853862.1 MotA/TolQ/ExbB proton channel family protein [Halobacteriovorax sp. GB3]
MDISTVIGLVVAVAAILGSMITGGGLGQFIDVPSVLVVGGGLIGVTFFKWPMETVKGIATVAMKSLKFDAVDPIATIEQMSEYANLARSQSIFALEEEAKKDAAKNNAFLKTALILAADNKPVEEIEKVLKIEIEAMETRHKIGQELFGGMAEDGPAMGMIGTLIGLVIMLNNMSDPGSIGPAMAVALLTTFYGAIIANVFCNPLKNKIGMRSAQEIANMNIIMAGIIGIVSGQNPKSIKSALSSFLPPSQRPADEV